MKHRNSIPRNQLQQFDVLSALSTDGQHSNDDISPINGSRGSRQGVLKLLVNIHAHSTTEQYSPNIGMSG